MTITKKSWAAALGLALVASATGGVALAAEFTGDPTTLAWHTADEATVPDADRSTIPLRLYDADGVEVTSGVVSAPLPAFAAAGESLRAGDTSATLYLHAAQSGTAAGAWPGLQATGTDRYEGAGAEQAPTAVTGRPFVRTADGATFADAVATFDRGAQGTYADVYELRLRTSSPSSGVGTRYAAAYVRVAGTTWSVVASPEPVVEPTPTTTTATAPAQATYGRAFSVSAQVADGAGGTVEVRSGDTVLGSAALGVDGSVSIPIGARALKPGTRTLTVAYSGSDTAAASSTTVTVRVAKASSTTTGRLSATRIKATTRAKVTVKVTAAGVPSAEITGAVTVRDGRKRLTGVTLTSAGRGSVVVTLPRLSVGSHSITVDFGGNAVVTASSGKAARLTVVR